MEKSLQKEFSNPSSMYRAKPFWAWNGNLEEKELRRQIRLLGKMGYGGFFMHSRCGLATPYLSKEWFKLAGDCADEAGRNKMEAWLYDEDRWPSGAAGGIVTRHPQFQMKYLQMKVQTAKIVVGRDEKLIAAFAVRLDGKKLVDMKRIKPGRALSRSMFPGGKILVFCMRTQDKSDWHNGETYLDVLNPKAVNEFIRVTHEGYRRHVGKQFGRTIPGIFTDEPNYGCGAAGLVLPWTGTVPEVFKRRYGYDLVNHLPEMFFMPAGVEFSRVRYHFIDCITWMFAEAFSRQVGEWCGRNKLLFTGHVLAEDTLSDQSAYVGSAMRFYEHMQAPGMDLLTEHWRFYDTAKQLSSVARQFGRKWRLSETDGCTGWDFSFAGHKALGDWQAVLGINVRCPHLAWYTMEGEAKRDYPASIFYQSPWWKDYRIVEDYFARIHTVMTRGEEMRDLLVVHPIESLWGTCRIGDGAWARDPVVAQSNRRFLKLRDDLLSNHIDFDYGDEDIMGRHGKVHAGPVPKIVIGKAAYKAVLVPPMKTIRASTLALFKKFRAAGGLVIFLDKAAEYVDALPSEAAAEFAAKCALMPNRASKFIPALENSCRRISVVDGQGNEIPSVLYLLRSDRDSYYLFLANSGHSRSQMKLPICEDAMVIDRKTAFEKAFVRGFEDCAGAPVEMDPASGKKWQAVAARKNEAWEIKTSFPALGTRLFVIPRKKTAEKMPARKEMKIARRVRLAKADWAVSLSEDNCLALDLPRYKIGAKAWKGPEEILRVDRAVRDAYGWKHRGGAMVQPWAQKESAAGKKGAVELKYEFNIETLPSGDVFLAVERPDLYAISVNGEPVDTDMDSGWWVDRSLRKLALPSGALKTGRNEIKLAGEYTAKHPGFEIIYLLGAFGVRLKNKVGCLTQMPRTLKIGDWCRQGLPFYSGSVGYTCWINPAFKAGERVVLNVPDYLGAAVKVWVDGKDAGYAPWPPYQADITAMLDNKKDRHELRIEVLGHRRNSHGPLHYAQKHPTWTGPGQYISEGDMWRDDYQLVPCGLQKPPELLTMKSK